LSDFFLPPDPRVEEPYRFTPQLAIRIAILGVVAVAVFAVLFFRLWALQVISGDEYLREARDNQIRTLRLQPPRGPILDSKGRPLVTNVAGTVVELRPADVPEGQLDDVVRRLSTLLDVPQSEIRKGIKARENDPLTPVMTMSDRAGSVRSTFFRLCVRAPRTVIWPRFDSVVTAMYCRVFGESRTLHGSARRQPPSTSTAVFVLF